LGFSVAINALPNAPLERAGVRAAADADRYDPLLASTQAALRRRDHPAWHLSSWRTVASKVPTWLGLGSLLALALLLARGEPVARDAAHR